MCTDPGAGTCAEVPTFPGAWAAAAAAVVAAGAAAGAAVGAAVAAGAGFRLSAAASICTCTLPLRSWWLSDSSMRMFLVRGDSASVATAAPSLRWSSPTSRTAPSRLDRRMGTSLNTASLWWGIP